MGLSFPVLEGIKRRGYNIPTLVQRKTIPMILEGRDVVAMARTGKFPINIPCISHEFNDSFSLNVRFW